MSIQLAYGLPGMGKSLLLHDKVSGQQRSDAPQRFFVADHENGWTSESIHWRGKPPKDIRVFTETEDLDSLFEEPYEFWEEKPYGVWVFQHCETQRIAELVSHVGDSVFVDDEIDLSARKKGWDDSPIRNIVHQGRHQPNAFGDYCINDIFGACRRPQNIHNDLSELASHIFVFRVQGTRTLGRLLENNTIEESQWDTIRTLPKFVYWDSPREANDFRGEFIRLPPIGPHSTKAVPKQRIKPNIQPAKTVRR